ncbi:MAG: Amidophosphoribosyltransferase [candidate division TM6 bacterium GW2011_GWE2_41_16]|nr:MAG: Amidophosphoribosyltransferase [candidate division TM6 bacterium GW2011_GWE2_41_16]
MTQENQTYEQEQKKLIRLIKAVVPEVKIYLYGSRAKGTYRRTSDFDIALDMGKKMDKLDLFEIKNVLEATNMPYRFDVIDLHNIDPEFKKSIERYMIPWMD